MYKKLLAEVIFISFFKTLQTLGREKESISEVAARLTRAMKNDEKTAVHWTLTTASTLYWRVKGDAPNAIKCLRHSLNNSPEHMKVCIF